MCHSFWGGFHKGWLEVGMPCIAVSILHFSCTLFRFIQGTGKHSLEDGSGCEIKADAETRKKTPRIELLLFHSISEPSLDPLPSGHLLQLHSNAGSRANLVAQDESGASPEINSSASQSEEPSLQLVRALFPCDAVSH